MIMQSYLQCKKPKIKRADFVVESKEQTGQRKCVLGIMVEFMVQRRTHWWGGQWLISEFFSNLNNVMILYFLYHTTLTRSHVYLMDYLSKRHDGKVFFFFLCHFIIFTHLTRALQADYLLFITKLIIPHLSWRTRCLLRSNLSVIIWRWGECTDQEGF